MAPVPEVECQLPLGVPDLPCEPPYRHRERCVTPSLSKPLLELLGGASELPNRQCKPLLPRLLRQSLEKEWHERFVCVVPWS